MKLKNKSKLVYVFSSLLMVILTVFLSACTEDENHSIIQTVSPGLNGQWQFTITPLEHYIDTTTLKGKNGNDFTADNCVNDEIYLYESNNQVTGYTGAIEFRGTVSDSIRLDVYELQDGRYGDDTSRLKTGEMILHLNSFGHMEGWGNNVLNTDAGAVYETYTIFARKLGNMPQGSIENIRMSLRSTFLDKLCSVVGSVISYITGVITGGVFRPMGGCWGEKDGGGFYAFGQTGPGSLLPAWTQTVYYPYEWAFCSTRVYNFDIDYEGSIIELALLKDIIRNVNPSWLTAIGFVNDSLIIAAVEDFYNIYGDFAITMVFNLETHNLGLYVNVENGSTSAHEHHLPHAISNAIGHIANVYAFSGRNIHDSWHMRRSNFFVCNTPLLFCYLFGTAKVKYN
jgi:hypothetical protein